MLFAGSDDGVYRIDGVRERGETTAEKVLDAERVFRIRQFDALEGLFATSKSGLYHSSDGSEWTALPLPEERAYAVAADPSGDVLYAGTRPARLFVAECDPAVPSGARDWEEVPGFRELRGRVDWGLPRHDGLAQIRSLRTHREAPDRIVAGVEVGGIHVSDDRGGTWTSRRIDGFDAPHTDDVHHVAMEDGETVVASTGSGLYRSADAGRTWKRLDGDHRQRYFREAFVHDGSIYAGGASGSSSSWEAGDHALFECHDGRSLEAVSSPTPDEVAVGWCAVDDDVLAATHRGTLLRRRPEGWRAVGAVPTPGSVRGRYLPLSWYAP
ncbi:WD40/YVTN/BNR-like repeat-containing protein [Haladaptatus salinisoli]|uniref:WD40/YVTN/BNR-like repeat-containing protein n=1 Tax=Haladaptatus salinisoli TaxID=2884876 RepID=UPI001D0A6F9A|nr:WD40 repeat domain-containing protein [Haladaptatus salinisoli]